MEPLVLGLDVGGTASRAIVTTLDGRRVGAGAAGAGNPVTVPLEHAAAAVAAALRQALAGLDPGRVGAAVLGIAGASGFAEDATAAAFTRVWDEAGLRCPVVALGDPVVAFAAGTDAASGTALIAGTGAAAAEVRGETMPRVADGLGWLLGDRGSGFWVGREAAAATADRLQRGQSPTPLSARVAEAVAGAAHPDADAFAVEVYRRPPRSLALLVPRVAAAADDGDAVAAAILAEAADHLAATVARVRERGDARPIVLCGGLVGGCAAVREGLRERLARRWPSAPILSARSAEHGAARLAARRLRAGTT